MNQSFCQNNYIHVPNFISQDRANKLAQEFIKFAKENELPGDSQIAESHSVYNYHGFLDLLCEKTPEISQFLGEPVLPTYSYARVYHNGATLERHRDREACEISITLHLSGDSDWPIYIQAPDGREIELNLSSGDGMMYMGCVADHWRTKFEGKEYVQVFLHYVRSRGENAWAVFDQTKERPVDFISIEQQEESAKPKPEYKKNLDDYIVEFEDILSPELCDEILKEFVDSDDWTPTYIGHGVVDRKIRNVDQVLITDAGVISRNREARQRIDNLLFEAAAKAITKYNKIFPEARIQQDSGYQLLRYQEGQFYKQHTDSFKAHPRAVSCSFALNDDFEGGGFAFFDNEFRHELKKGSALMFPSNFMYPHEVLPVTKGTRYSIITWFV
jgi:predicted 2-oxoglutarate/Fe(II)-dependent dioxygenase YbiX